LAAGEKGIRLNFRGVSLDVVPSYLSKEAGFIVNLETPVNGKVDIWSEQPLTIDDAVDLLDSVLAKNGYTAILTGRKLTIVSKSAARSKDIPVRLFSVTNRVEDIPQNDEMVTETIQVRYANAVNMTRDLEPLRPEYATLTANESANALVVTATQADVRRFAEIVRALDTSISGILSVSVFPLKFADAKDLANEIKELFPAQNNNPAGSGGLGGGFSPMQMRFGGGNAAGGGGTSEARQAASRVTAVADEHTNSLVVSAPAEVLAIIKDLVEEVDKNAENVIQLRVFHLRYADPVETADLLTGLFPEDSGNTTSANRTALQFGRGGFGAGAFFGRAGGTTPLNQSVRAQQQMRVVAVADPRTASLVVTASKDLMPEIAQMITRLDANPAKRQHTFVYKLDHADSDNVQQVLQDMFGSTMQTANSQSLQNNALNTRQLQAAQSIGQSILQQSSVGQSSFGGSSP